MSGNSNNAKIKKILRNLIIGLIVTAVLTAAMIIYDYGIISWAFCAAGIIISILLSRSYLLIKALKTTVGVITDTNVKIYANRAIPSSDKMTSPIIDEKYPAHGAYYERVVILTVETKKGKKSEKAFPFNRITEKLKVGDRISFSYLDDYPTIL